MQRAALGVIAGVVAAATFYLAGPSLYVLGLPLAAAALLLGASSLRGKRDWTGFAACSLGLAAVLIPFVQFALQS